MPPLRRRPLGRALTKTLAGDSLSRRAGNPPPTTLLDALMGYVATFFHGHGQAQMRRLVLPGPRTLRVAPSRRQLHTSTRGMTLLSTGVLGLDDDSRGQPSLNSQPARRNFHNYFVTHLPSSSLHPDSRTSAGPHHKLPRSASTPHTPGPGSVPAVVPPNMPSRDLTVVRIPLRSAKHHYGVANSRGQRVYNEDTNQAGTINMPAFAKRAPISLVRSQMKSAGEGTSADSALGDPQVFYFAVFDGHGGNECSDFLRDELHGYIEDAAQQFKLTSSLAKANQAMDQFLADKPGSAPAAGVRPADRALEQVKLKSAEEVMDKLQLPTVTEDGHVEPPEHPPPVEGNDPVPMNADTSRAVQLESSLLREYKNTVGGYFRRFNSPYFSIPSTNSTSDTPKDSFPKPVTIEGVLTYAFLRADLDFITAQARKPDPDDPYISETPLNKDEVLGHPHLPPSGHGIGGPVRFKGGSTASIALISTPTPAPFWHPAARSTLMIAHVGDTRVLLCETATGLSLPLTNDHHPSSPTESRRLRRFAESITDSFGEERISGLANSRAFGDMQSKRVGVSAEPDITRIELGPAEYSFIVLMSDGVSATLSDQEIVDVVKEARTPEEGARNVVEYATEVSSNGDNATCLVVRLGGWERRSEGGLGSLGTKEIRDIRRAEALDPRRGRR
ncbi:protein serine/threonine phosphatase 2C [Podospora appendiculata]|uniref:Protein serine/threonine phosphatase 2C n=1 Tax=Podospora appendiculata TaxID=314037 RepID=A0AAE0X3D7_9PEZI|nr:protein serine/threonine phosphatase 2C [Podospora appendiculata]